jgi:hypothetical protein
VQVPVRQRKKVPQVYKVGSYVSEGMLERMRVEIGGCAASAGDSDGSDGEVDMV